MINAPSYLCIQLRVDLMSKNLDKIAQSSSKFHLALSATIQFIVTLFSVATLHAQSVPSIPSVPLVAPIPEMVKLTLFFQEEPKENTSLQAETPSSLSTKAITWKSVEITKTGEIQLIRTTTTDGKSYITWCIGGKLFGKTFDGKQIFCMSYDLSIPLFFQASGISFYSTEWIAMENFKGIVSFHGKRCYFFEKMASASAIEYNLPYQGRDLNPPSRSKDEASSPTNSLKAWIDVTNKLPVAVKLSEGLVLYHFDASPKSPLIPPTEYVEYYLKKKKESERRQQEAAAR